MFDCGFISLVFSKKKNGIRRGGHKKIRSRLKEKCEFWETRCRFVLQSLGLRLPMYIYMPI